MQGNPAALLWSCAANCLLFRADVQPPTVHVGGEGENVALDKDDFWHDVYAQALLVDIDADPAVLDALDSQLAARLRTPAPAGGGAAEVYAEEGVLLRRARRILTGSGADTDLHTRRILLAAMARAAVLRTFGGGMPTTALDDALREAIDAAPDS